MTEENAMVFIVEDDEAVRDSIELMMESVDQPAKTYADAQAFLDDYNSGMSVCIVMDVRMPVMDGLEDTRRLRESGADWSEIPVAALTANASEQEADACFDAGMDSFASKPLKPAILFDAMRRACELRPYRPD